MMWFAILGPLLVHDGNAVVGVPAARQRALLAILLMRAGSVVPADALAELVWDGTPPTGHATTLRSHVMRLRRLLGPGPGGRVVTRYPGYLVDAGEEEVDLLRFASLCREGGTAVRAGAWERASGMLSEALGLWRGEPLADIPSELLRREEVPRLEQLRLQALEWRIDAGLHMGRHAELIPELHSMSAQHPLRERFHAQLMLALVRCGRQAEALEEYQRTRSKLVEELGSEPGTELREMHQRILTGDPALAVPEPATLAASRSGPVTPRELPASVTHFTGRANELAALTRLLDQAGEQVPGTVVISAIGGAAGVGKTALAVHWARQVAERFPDGQLYVNLRGYDPGQPMPTGDALAGFLRALGMAGPDIPAEEAERAARYRSMLAGRRMLVVLDNAGSAEQVRPLLPGAPACMVVVTSRDALAGLVARDGARRVDLDLLSEGEAVSLLRALIGGRVDNEPGAAAMLAAQCARLPLALRVAAELAATHPAAPLAELVGELADQQRRLDLLDAGGDPHTAVRAVLSWSYRHLDADTARVYRLVGLHPGPDIDRYGAAALAGVTLERVSELLDQAAHAHVVRPTRPGRYSMHDLLRVHARDLASAQDTEEERRAALTRLFDYFLHTAAAAMDVLHPGERHRRPRVPAPASPVPPVTETAAARTWLDAEQANLIAAAAHATACGWHSHAVRLAATTSRYLDLGGHYSAAITIHGHARRAASRAGDRAAEAEALTNLGTIEWHQGRLRHATRHYHEALIAFRECADLNGQARTLHNLGGVDMLEGHFGQAADQVRQAMVLFHEAGDRAGEARSLQNLGFVELRRGCYHEATGHLRRALDLFRQTGDRAGQAHALANLGTVDLEQGHFQQAAGHLRRALDLFHQTSNRAGQAHVLGYLGLLDLRQGRTQQATSRLQQSLALFRETGEVPGEAEALNGLGEAAFASGQVSHARAQHRAALALAGSIGDKYEQARAHNGLARSHHAAGDPGQARHHWRQALTLYTALGVPEAGKVGAQLTTAEAETKTTASSRPPRSQPT
jgi:DNA-binding SARP family transcriptional activator/tetratricopeptide (TPR) repeat protein